MNLDYERLKNLTPDTITTAISLLLTTGEHPQLARSLALTGSSQALARFVVLSGASEDLARFVAGSGAGRDLARSLAGSAEGLELARSLAGSAEGLELARYVAFSGASEDLARFVAGSGAGRDLARFVAGGGAGLELARSLADTGGDQKLAQLLAESGAGLELAQFLAGIGAGDELALFLAGSGAGQDLARLLAESGACLELEQFLLGRRRGLEFVQSLAGRRTGKKLARSLAGRRSHLGGPGETSAGAVLVLTSYFGGVLIAATAVTVVAAHLVNADQGHETERLSNEYEVSPVADLDLEDADRLLRETESLRGSARYLIDHGKDIPDDARDGAEADLSDFVKAYERPGGPLPPVLRAYQTNIAAFVAKYSGASTALAESDNPAAQAAGQFIDVVAKAANDPEAAGNDMADAVAELAAQSPELTQDEAINQTATGLWSKVAAVGVGAAGVGALGTYILNVVTAMGLGPVTAVIASLVVGTLAALGILYHGAKKLTIGHQ